jgi:iron-sulfur cluster assembly protein
MALETQKATITLTEKAASAVQDMLAERELEGYALRVFVSNSGCGCSGPQYGMALEANQNPNDSITHHHGVDLIVDDVSAAYLEGATIDYIEDQTGVGFKIETPNPVSGSCGCGSSCSC